MKQTINRQEIEQLLNSFKTKINKLEYDLATGLALNYANPRLHDILDSLTHLRVVVQQLDSSLLIPTALEFDMNFGMFLDIEKAKSICSSNYSLAEKE